MKAIFEKILGVTPWKKEWQDELSTTLSHAQRGLGVNMVVVIARESDLYAEVLFLLSFAGLVVGAATAHFCRDFVEGSDLVMFPILGFALGSTLFAFRRFFINRLAPRAIRDRVSGRAKALFFDHYQHLKGRLALLYFSELECEALFLASPELSESTPGKEIQRALSLLIMDYKHKNPMASLGPAITALGELLRAHYGSGDAEGNREPIYVGASDRLLPFQVPILKGSKDLN